MINYRKHTVVMGGTGSGKTYLSKSLLEDLLEQGVPLLAVDSQGDLAPLCERYGGNIWTPCSSSGKPLCVDPLDLNSIPEDEPKRTLAIGSVSSLLASFLGDGKPDTVVFFEAIITTCLEELSFYPDSTAMMMKLVRSNPVLMAKVCLLLADKITDSRFRNIQSMVSRNLFGSKGLLMTFGDRFTIDSVVNSGANVVYLNTLTDESQKQFVVAFLTQALHLWMMRNPSKSLGLMFFIDEIADYFPPQNKKRPVCKEPLLLLFKQARKYGVGCMVSTQSPGDMDYLGLGQFNSWIMGRMISKQDITKVSAITKGIAPQFRPESLQSMAPHNFVLMSPDLEDRVTLLPKAELRSRDTIMTEEDIEELYYNRTGAENLSQRFSSVTV